MSHPHLRDIAPADNSANGTVIEYYVKNVYGRENIYIVPGPAAKSISALTGKKTVSIQDIVHLELLGVKATEVLAPR